MKYVSCLLVRSVWENFGSYKVYFLIYCFELLPRYLIYSSLDLSHVSKWHIFSFFRKSVQITSWWFCSCSTLFKKVSYGWDIYKKHLYLFWYFFKLGEAPSYQNVFRCPKYKPTNPFFHALVMQILTSFWFRNSSWHTYTTHTCLYMHNIFIIIKFASIFTPK